MDLTWLYALALQAVAVVTLIYVVAIVGARTLAPRHAAPPTPPRRKSHA